MQVPPPKPQSLTPTCEGCGARPGPETRLDTRSPPGSEGLSWAPPRGQTPASFHIPVHPRGISCSFYCPGPAPPPHCLSRPGSMRNRKGGGREEEAHQSSWVLHFLLQLLHLHPQELLLAELLGHPALQRPGPGKDAAAVTANLLDSPAPTSALSTPQRLRCSLPCRSVQAPHCSPSVYLFTASFPPHLHQDLSSGGEDAPSLLGEAQSLPSEKDLPMEEPERGEGREKEFLSVRKTWEAELLFHIQHRDKFSGHSGSSLRSVYPSG